MQHATVTSHAEPVAAKVGADIVKFAKRQTETFTARLAHADLLAAVVYATRTIERRCTIPILGNVLLEATRDGMRIAATNLDILVSVGVRGEVDTDFAVTVPGAMFADILKKSKKASEVVLTSKPDGHVGVRVGALDVALLGLPVDDFPELVGIDDVKHMTHVFEMPTADLRRSLGRVEFAMSTEETRYYLNGVYMHLLTNRGGKSLSFTATDGHRLSTVETVTYPGCEKIPGVIIPCKTVVELLKALGAKGAADTTRIRLSGAKIEFKVGGTTIQSKLVDGTFPDYQRVVPKGNDKKVRLDVDQLKEAIAMVSTVSSERGRAVKLSMSLSAVKLTVQNPDTGTASMVIDADYNGEPMDIGFNSRYLTDILDQVESDVIEVALADPGSPALIAGQSGGDAGVRFVLMPMRV